MKHRTKCKKENTEHKWYLGMRCERCLATMSHSEPSNWINMKNAFKMFAKSRIDGGKKTSTLFERAKKNCANCLGPDPLGMSSGQWHVIRIEPISPFFMCVCLQSRIW